MEKPETLRKPETSQFTHQRWHGTAQIVAGGVILLLAGTMFAIATQRSRIDKIIPSLQHQDMRLQEMKECSKTCRIGLVESIAQNLTFGERITSMSTYDAWKKLIGESKNSLLIAAYKSSLRGKHVFGSLAQSYSNQVIYSIAMTVLVDSSG